MIDLVHLHTFTTLVQEGNMTRAAERLHLSQPAASHHLRALEEQLGLPLFTRTPKGLQPTAAGSLLAQRASILLALSADLEVEARQLKGSASGRLSIATVEDAEVLVLLAELARWIKTHFPLIDISYSVHNSPSIRQGILAGELDGGFFVGIGRGTELAGYELAQREFVVAGPYDWREKLAHATWSSLSEFPWVVTPQGTSHSEVANRIFQLHGTSIQPFIEVSNEMLMRAMIIGGIGIGFVRNDFAIDAAEKKQLFIVPETQCTSTLHFAYAKKRANDPTINVLLNAMEEQRQLSDTKHALSC